MLYPLKLKICAKLLLMYADCLPATKSSSATAAINVSACSSIASSSRFFSLCGSCCSTLPCASDNKCRTVACPLVGSLLSGFGLSTDFCASDDKCLSALCPPVCLSLSCSGSAEPSMSDDSFVHRSGSSLQHKIGTEQFLTL